MTETDTFIDVEQRVPTQVEDEQISPPAVCPPSGVLRAENRYTCCCTDRITDKRLLTFISSLSISVIVILFSCVQLYTKHDCSSQHLYSSLITLIIGVWIAPQPI